jgi:hypothetical protein
MYATGIYGGAGKSLARPGKCFFMYATGIYRGADRYSARPGKNLFNLFSCMLMVYTVVLISP